MCQKITIIDQRKMAEGMSEEKATTHIVKSVIPTIAEMKKENAAKRIEQKKKEVSAMSDEELQIHIKKDMRFGKVVSDIAEYLNKTFPEASFLIVGDNPKTEYNIPAMKKYGDEKTISENISFWMNMQNGTLKIINDAIAKFCMESKKAEAENCITALEDLIRSLKLYNDPEVRIKQINDEIKRLSRKGRSDLVKIKENDLIELKAELAKKERDIQLKKQRLQNLAKGRETLRLKREAEAKKAQEREKQRNSQPNFAKMAKKKMQKIAQRQAEKKKKSASESNSVKSCSMFNNVG